MINLRKSNSYIFSIQGSSLLTYSKFSNKRILKINQTENNLLINVCYNQIMLIENELENTNNNISHRMGAKIVIKYHKRFKICKFSIPTEMSELHEKLIKEKLINCVIY